jgi:hypothetical protein
MVSSSSSSNNKIKHPKIFLSSPDFLVTLARTAADDAEYH